MLALPCIGGVRRLVVSAPAGVPRIDEARVNTSALLFACAIALLSSLLFGLVPALRSAAARLGCCPDAGAQVSAATSAHSTGVGNVILLTLHLTPLV